jgi:outer membrane protein OmpA-like peptidoglycan-associated protein
MDRGRQGGQHVIHVALLAVCIALALPAVPAPGQPATSDDIVNQLAGLETTTEVDIPSLRQDALARIKSKANSEAVRRPPIAPQLNKLPHLDLDIQFNPGSPVIRPDSYRMLGRVADALSDPRLLSFGFLIVGHTEVSGRREDNLTLSQRRAESFRDVLVTTFKISPKRIQAVGLGEEQLADADHPKAPVNQQIQIMSVRKGL